MPSQAPDLVEWATLGRVVRGGAPETLGTPSEDEVLRHFTAGDPAAARAWLDYAVGEKARNLDVFTTWLEELLRIGRERVAGFDRELVRLSTAIGRDVPLVSGDAVGRDELARVSDAIDGGDARDLASSLDVWVDAVREIHDVQADWCWGAMSVLHRSLGEAAMEEVLRSSLNPWVAVRYERLAELTHEQRMQLTVEAMRGHLGGPTRRGELQVVEEPDRWVVSFDPCGTGGRMLRGDPERALAPRTEPPFEFVVLEEAHDWTWGEREVCLYCAHCSFVNETLPIDAIGTPLRMTLPPSGPDDRCRWVLFKSAEQVPDEAFERVGRRRPA